MPGGFADGVDVESGLEHGFMIEMVPDVKVDHQGITETFLIPESPNNPSAKIFGPHH